MELILAVVVGVALGGVVVWFAQEVRAKSRIATLEGRLSEAKTGEQLLESAKEQLRETFEATASHVTANNNEAFLQLANENLGKTLEKASGEFKERHEQFSALVKPLSENYEKLNPNIESLMKQNSDLVRETTKLSSALSDNRQVGYWGEIQLRRVVEMAQMTAYCDFVEQSTVSDGRDRPDLTVRLPEGRAVVVDAKASAAAFLEAQQAEDEAAADVAMRRHAQSLKTQVDSLAKKDYGAAVQGSLDFVVMFVPGDLFLAEALKSDPNLLPHAISKRVALATPSTLVSLLWAVNHGWQQHRLAQHAEEIVAVGEEMFNRLQRFLGYYQNVGKNLNSAVRAFNDSVGSYDRRVVPQGRRFTQLLKDNEGAFPVPDALDITVTESQYFPSLTEAASEDGDDVSTPSLPESG